MEKVGVPVVKPLRGRPRSGSKAQTVEALLSAAEKIFERDGHLRATERAIAAAARVNPAMIRYYFGGMDGLLFASVDKIASEILDAFTRLQEDALWHHQNPTRHLIKSLIDAYYSKPWLARIICSEMTQDNSVIRDWFLKRYGPQGLVQIRRVLEQLVESGVYRPDLNLAHVSLSIFSIIIAPLSITLFSGSLGLGLDDLRNDDWIDHVAALFDGQLRASPPTIGTSIKAKNLRRKSMTSRYEVSVKMT